MIIFFQNIVHGAISLIVVSWMAVSGVITPVSNINQAITPTISPVITSAINPKDTPSPTPLAIPISKKTVVFTPTPYPTAVPNLNTSKAKENSATRIEICKTNAEQQRANYVQAGDNLLAQERPQIAELANTSNNQETENIALKYGLIKQSDIVRAADVYQKLTNEGNPQDHAKSIAESMANTWWVYLKNLHDWAVKERDNYRASVATKADNSKNDYYTRCLNYEK